jgi:hypothetical protein
MEPISLTAGAIATATLVLTKALEKTGKSWRKGIAIPSCIRTYSRGMKRIKE